MKVKLEKMVCAVLLVNNFGLASIFAFAFNAWQVGSLFAIIALICGIAFYHYSLPIEEALEVWDDDQERMLRILKNNHPWFFDEALKKERESQYKNKIGVQHDRP